MQKCSYCGKENDDEAVNCGGCGTPLREESNSAQSSEASTPEDSRRTQGEKLMLQGALWFIGGAAVTIFSYLAAATSPLGGQYIVAYGAIIFGIVQFVRGRAIATGTDGESRAQELLDIAARIENVDRAKAAALYAEIASRFPGTRASEEAQRNAQTLASLEK